MFLMFENRILIVRERSRPGAQRHKGVHLWTQSALWVRCGLRKRIVADRKGHTGLCDDSAKFRPARSLCNVLRFKLWKSINKNKETRI